MEFCSLEADTVETISGLALALRSQDYYYQRRVTSGGLGQRQPDWHMYEFDGSRSQQCGATPPSLPTQGGILDRRRHGWHWLFFFPGAIGTAGCGSPALIRMVFHCSRVSHAPRRVHITWRVKGKKHQSPHVTRSPHLPSAHPFSPIRPPPCLFPPLPRRSVALLELLERSA